MYYILYSPNKVAREKKTIKKIIRERKYIYITVLYLLKKFTCKWTCAFLSHIVQGSTVHGKMRIDCLLLKFACLRS